MKIKSKTQTYRVHTQNWGDEIQLTVDGKVSYFPIGALTQIIDALAVIEKSEYYKTVFN